MIEHVITDCDTDVAVDRVQGCGRIHHEVTSLCSNVNGATCRRDDLNIGIKVDGACCEECDVARCGLDVGVGLCRDIGAGAFSGEEDITGTMGDHCCVAVQIIDRGAFGQSQVTSLGADHDATVVTIRVGGHHVALGVLGVRVERCIRLNRADQDRTRIADRQAIVLQDVYTVTTLD